MADISSVVSITITASTLGLVQQGFGVALILSSDAAFAERIRFYTDIDGVEEDFATPTVTYRMAQALFGQAIQPAQVAIGRSANKPTQKYTLTPIVANSTAYTVYINGTAYTYTSDASATDTEIVDGLAALINAGTGDTTTATTPGAPGTETLVLTANAAGDYDAVEVASTALLSIVQDHADPGIAADLAAIALESNAWYFILYPYNSKACAIVIATYAQANEKLYVCDTADSANITLAIGGDSATSIMGQFKTSAYDRSAVIYHPDPGDFIAAAWVGRVSPLDPGSETWAHKTLAGPAAVNLTGTHIVNVEAKSGNHYTEVAGRNLARWGTVSNGDYIDTIRFLDWLEARMGEDVALVLFNANKIPFTDGGIAAVQGAIKNVLDEGIASGGLTSDPAPVVTVPRASAVSTANKALRRLTGVKFSATLAGAIHKVTIAGNVSV